MSGTEEPAGAGGAQPLTVGTAGHIDHGKTALVRALTGVETDRLPEEKARGITIVLGFAPLPLPSGRTLSLVDVPGHERLVRVMVAGASGIDMFLLAVAADDGVMPQTREHIRVLRALGVDQGVIAITKCDLADPGPVAGAAGELLPGAEAVPCSVRTGDGIEELRAALDRVAARLPGREQRGEHAILHIDRVFTIRGAGTVVTGTLWSGTIFRGQRLQLLPSGRTLRVRAVQVHDQATQAAPAGQRVAVNVVGAERREIQRGDLLADPSARVRPVYRVEVELRLDAPLRDGERVQVHHGTRATPARAMRLSGNRWQLRCERPLLAADGDRVVLRRVSPPDTLGGGVILETAARGRHPPGQPPATAAPVPHTAAPVPHAAAPVPRAAATPELDAGALALEERLRAAGHEPPSEAELGEDARHLSALHAAGRAVRIGRSLHAHPDAIAGVRRLVEQVIERDGSITLARLRDELGTSRKFAQALLEHLDAARVTRRLPDDSRVLRSNRRS